MTEPTVTQRQLWDKNKLVYDLWELIQSCSSRADMIALLMLSDFGDNDEGIVDLASGGQLNLGLLRQNLEILRRNTQILLGAVGAFQSASVEFNLEQALAESRASTIQ